MKMPFTKQLLQQVKKQGYAHIQQRGVENKPNPSCSIAVVNSIQFDSSILTTRMQRI
jgi:hypothetical protein